MSHSKITGPRAPISGTVNLPLSKSIANRLLIIESLSGKSRKFPEHQLPEDIVILQNLLGSSDVPLNAHHAGTAYRFLLAYLCLQQGTFILDGSNRMRKRPIGILVQCLRSLGADIHYLQEEGFPPVRIVGRKLRSGGQTISLRADISSQFISALMMIGPYVEGGLALHLEGKILSKPYIQLTADIMKEAGAEMSMGLKNIVIKEKPYGQAVKILERDWSAVPYFLSLLFLQNGNELFFPGLQLNSRQGDSIAADWFIELGLRNIERKDGISFQFSANEKPDVFDRNLIDQPDLIPTFALLCLAGGIKARISGCDNLNFKESNRLDVLRETVKLCGAKVLPSGTSTELFFDPPANLFIPENHLFPTLDDHRLAMSYSLLSCNGQSITIIDKRVVKKSFPAYWEELTHLGFEVEVDQ